jgi:5-methylcytosine-specific restriction endonuclease McrA
MAAKQRVYRERHTESSRAMSNRYAAEHRSERAAYKADWQRKNAATVNARTSLWAKKNRQTTRAAGERYRARSLNAAGAGVTGSDRKRLLSESFGLCAYCFLPAWRLELDHVDPISRGGMHDPENMVASCRRCNASKNDSTLLVWLAERQLRERILQGETVGA